MLSRRASTLAASFLVAVVSCPEPLLADDTARESVPLFAIRKTENRNRVQYVVAVDAACRPRGTAPVHAYGRMLERGPGVREPLAPFERMAYGMVQQRVGEDAAGARVEVVLRALRSRPIVVRFDASSGHCAARPTASVNGVACAIDDVLVVQRGPLTVDHVELEGRSVATGTTCTEHVRR